MIFFAALFGSALLVFFYALSKRRLDFDEEPKYILFQEDD